MAPTLRDSVLLRKRAAIVWAARGTGIAARAAPDKCLIPERDETADDLPLREAAMKCVPKIPLMQPTQDVAMQKNVTGYQYWFHRQLDFRTLSKQ